jgi:hypothetical protein
MYAEIARDTLASEDVDDTRNTSRHPPVATATLPGRGGTEDVITQMLISDDVRRVESKTRAPTLLHSIHSTLHHVCRGSPMCAMILAFPQHPGLRFVLPVSKSNRLKSAAGCRGTRPRRAPRGDGPEAVRRSCPSHCKLEPWPRQLSTGNSTGTRQLLDRILDSCSTATRQDSSTATRQTSTDLDRP